MLKCHLMLQLAASGQPMLLLVSQHLCCLCLVVASVWSAGRQMLTSYSSLVGMPVLAPAVHTVF